ncbi:MAG: mechanosensitive ion channel family protein [Candidatus Aenigmatarchaeota archaeon]|jgi:hypothetical protein
MNETLFLNEIYTSFVNYIPNLIAFFILIFLGWGIGKIVGKIFEEIIKRSKIEKIIFREKKPIISLTSFFSLLASWSIYLIFIQAAVEVLGIKVISDIISSIVNYIPRIFLFSVVMIVGYVFSEYLRVEIEKNKIKFKELISRIVFWIGIYVSLLIALPILGIRTFILEILLVILVLSVSLPFSVAFTLVLKDELKKDIKKWMKKVRI